MTQAMEGLVAPEGVYLPTSSYTLPPAPPYLTPSALATLQGTTAASHAASNANGASAGSGSLSGIGSGAGQAGPAAASPANALSSSAGSGIAAANGPDGSGENGEQQGVGGETEMPKTALHHISMQAPSAWSHVPIPPSSKISVSSIRYPASEGSAMGSGVADSTSTPLIGPVLEASLAAQGIDGPASHVTGGQGGLPGMSALQLLAHLGGGPPPSLTASMSASTSSNAFTTGKTLLKPKNNIKQTSSSFVQRLGNHTEYAKLFGPRPDGNTLERFAFVSRGRMLYWLGETGNGWIKDPLARLTFGTTITSHDVNQLTRSPSRLDVAIAFTTSDIIWFEAMSSRYTRLNKAGCVNDSPIASIRWVPGSEMLLFTTHIDGTCTLFDVYRDDSVNGSWTPIRGLTVQNAEAEGVGGKGKKDREEEEAQEVLIEGQRSSLHQDQATAKPGATLASPTTLARGAGREEARGAPKPAIKPWDPTSRILVTRPALNEGAGEAGLNKKTWSKLNPVAHWRVSRSSSITDVAFSPDHTKLAIVSTDGLLRIINLLTETLEGSFEAYYGALNKVVFSPDARFLLTAGCDDLVSVWTSEGRLLGRCPGHSSFVTGLAFDPWRWRVEDKTYRFGSVGEDGKVLLWDFSSAALVRPKMSNSASFQRRGNHGGSTFSLLQEQHHRRYSGQRRASMNVEEADQASSTPAAYSKAPPRGEVAELQPVASFQIGRLTNGEQVQSSGGLAASASLASSTTGASASAMGGQTTASGAGGGASPSSTAAVPASVNNLESGSPGDLLVDVRFRPDGILIMHKSGTLRFLQRPRLRSITRNMTADVGQRSAVR